jgi:hypothetical protein
MLIEFSDAAKHHELTNYSTSQVMTDLEMCIVTKYMPLSIMLAPSSSSEVVKNFEMCIVLLLSITLSSSE